MKKVNIWYCVMCLLLMTSCYEDYVKDYDTSVTYFASQKPLRTVIADRDMAVRVGVAIGGKREVDKNDWAEFEIVPSLLDGTGLTLLPTTYYTLSDANTFRVSKTSLAVADVEIKFTDAFYADAASVDIHYALPFRLKSSSLDEIPEDMNYSIVAIKYVSTYHGTYYIKGKVNELSTTGEIVKTDVYENKDLSKNDTRNVNTLAKNVLLREGVGKDPVVATEKVKMTFMTDHTVKVETADGGITITDGSGTFTDSQDKLEVSLKYRYVKAGKKYEVIETLIRRQDPLKDLRFEEW